MRKELKTWRRPAPRDLFEQVHELAESMLSSLQPWSPAASMPSLLPDFPAWRSDLRVQETPNEVVVFASVPGAEKKDIRIDATEDTLTIQGERRLERSGAEDKVREEGFASFRQTVRLPVAVRAREARASLKEGLLRVTLPKASPSESHRIEIK